MAGSRFEDTIEGRLERLEQLLATVVEQQVAILDKLGEPVAKWLDVPAAALYLSTSPRSVRYAVETDRLRAHKSGSGRLRFRPEDLDSFARSGDGAR